MTDYGILGSDGSPDFLKDPDSVEDYEFNWIGELNGDTISTSSFLLPDGLTQVSASNTTTTATVFVSGGSSGHTYRITNRIVTAGGRTHDSTYRVYVMDR
jgi:hypothetical protein